MTIKKGIYAASMTIFNEKLLVDADSTIKHSEKLIKNGCHGCVLFGSTGQAQLISSNEKKEVIEKLSNNKDQRLRTEQSFFSDSISHIVHADTNGILEGESKTLYSTRISMVADDNSNFSDEIIDSKNFSRKKFSLSFRSYICKRGGQGIAQCRYISHDRYFSQPATRRGT